MTHSSYHEHVELIQIIDECISAFPQGLPVVFRSTYAINQQNGFLVHEDGKLYIEYYCEPRSWKPVRMDADAAGNIVVSGSLTSSGVPFQKGAWRFSLVVKLATNHTRLHELYAARAPRDVD